MNEFEKCKYVKGCKLGEGIYVNVYLGYFCFDLIFFVVIKKIKV